MPDLGDCDEREAEFNVGDHKVLMSEVIGPSATGTVLEIVPELIQKHPKIKVSSMLDGPGSAAEQPVNSLALQPNYHSRWPDAAGI